jgi:hypothetical protein
MSLRALSILAIFTFITFGNAATAQQPNRPEVSIQKLRNAAAQDVVQALTTFTQQKKLSLSFVAEPVSNTVFVAGDAAHVKQAVELIAAIDKQPPQIVAQLLIVEVPIGYAKDIGLAEGTEDTWSLTDRETRMLNSAIRDGKQINILSRPQITTADNQTAYLKVGGGVNFSAFITPRVMPDGGVLARIETGVKGSSGATPEVQHATAKAQDGGTMVVRMAQSQAKDNETSELLLIMTVHVLKH